VFFNEDYIFVPESKTEAGRRKVPMSARFKQRLWERRNSAKSIWVYPGRRGEGHLKSTAVGFRNARRKAGVDKRKVLYTARHTFGTYTLAASQNLPAVMRTMGHASVNSTLPYQHHGMESIRAAIAARNGAAQTQAERSAEKTRDSPVSGTFANAAKLLKVLVDAVGIEPTTCRLRVECSAS
jgi:integrase